MLLQIHARVARLHLSLNQLGMVFVLVATTTLRFVHPAAGTSCLQTKASSWRCSQSTGSARLAHQRASYFDKQNVNSFLCRRWTAQLMNRNVTPTVCILEVSVLAIVLILGRRKYKTMFPFSILETFDLVFVWILRQRVSQSGVGIHRFVDSASRVAVDRSRDAMLDVSSKYQISVPTTREVSKARKRKGREDGSHTSWLSTYSSLGWLLVRIEVNMAVRFLSRK